MKRNLPIGFFDSGVGGLSVLSRFKKVLPGESTLYFGDLKNLPYGNKSKDELVGFAKNILDFYKAKNVKAVAIACNTSSALAYDEIKDDYEFRIYPIIQSCAKVISGMNVEKVGVFATIGTVSSGAYKKEINKYNLDIKVQELACPNWVNIVESKSLVGIDEDLDIENHVKEMLSFNPDKIILGCTHYPYLLNKLENYLPRDVFIDPAEIFVEFIKSDLKEQELLADNTNPTTEFYVSADPEAFIQNAKLFYDLRENPIVV